MIRFHTDMLRMDTVQALEVVDNGDHYIIKASGQREPQVRVLHEQRLHRVHQSDCQRHEPHGQGLQL